MKTNLPPVISFAFFPPKYVTRKNIVCKLPQNGKSSGQSSFFVFYLASEVVIY